MKENELKALIESVKKTKAELDKRIEKLSEKEKNIASKSDLLEVLEESKINDIKSLSSFLGNVRNTEKGESMESNEFKQLRELIINSNKEVAKLQEKIDAQDKKIEGFGIQVTEPQVNKEVSERIQNFLNQNEKDYPHTKKFFEASDRNKNQLVNSFKQVDSSVPQDKFYKNVENEFKNFAMSLGVSSDAKPADAKPADDKPTGDKPADDKPADDTGLNIIDSSKLGKNKDNNSLEGEKEQLSKMTLEQQNKFFENKLREEISKPK